MRRKKKYKEEEKRILYLESLIFINEKEKSRSVKSKDAYGLIIRIGGGQRRREKGGERGRCKTNRWEKGVGFLNPFTFLSEG